MSPMKPKSWAERQREKEGRGTTDKEYDRRRMLTPELAAAKELRSSRPWQKVRKLYLDKNPMCQDPFDYHRQCGYGEPAAQVHHIVGLSQEIGLALSMGNLAGLCTKCHAKIERMERRKEPTQHLFPGQSR